MKKKEKRFLWKVLFLLGCFFLVPFIREAGLWAGPEKKAVFKPALPGWNFQFPRDHRVHRDFKTEWWYYNGHLRDGQGERFGYQLTFFRVGLVPGTLPGPGSHWRIKEMIMAHLALTDIRAGTFRFLEKAGRGNLGLAGAEENRYRVWVENWSVEEERTGHVLLAGDRDFGLRLRVLPVKAPAIHGRGGVSRKGEGVGRASHYYSLTRLQTQGVLFLKGKEVPVTGSSWMDHEFGSDQLQDHQIGWDWFSMQLDNNLDLMIYQIRNRDGGLDPYSSGSLILPDAATQHLTRTDFHLRVLDYWKSTRSGAVYPASWEIEVPGHQLRVRLTPLVSDQELMTLKSTRVTYWEGAVSVQGQFRGRPIRGKGYVEMTGYDRRFAPKI